MPFRPTRPGAPWTSCHADDADARRHVSTETWELVQVVFFTTIAWIVAGFGMNLVAVGILVLVAADAGTTVAWFKTSSRESRSLFSARPPLPCAAPDLVWTAGRYHLGTTPAGAMLSSMDASAWTVQDHLRDKPPAVVALYRRFVELVQACGPFDFRISAPEQLDEEFAGWVREAYQVGQGGHLAPQPGSDR
jgi:hypothetical protein